MNILYINHYAGSPEMGMEFRPYYLAREWQKMGHKVRIVAGSYSHLRKNNPIVTKDYEIQMVEGVEYQWIKTQKYEGNGAKRAITMAEFCGKLMLRAADIATSFKPDIVISSSTYPLDAYPARRIANIASAKHIHEIHDMWPITPMELYGMSKSHPFVKIMQMGENYFCKNADKIVSILPCADKYLMGHGMALGKYETVTNGINLDDWENCKPLPEQIRNKIDKAHKEGRLVIGFFGSHTRSYSLDYLIKAAVKYKDKLYLALVGDGNYKSDLITLAQELGYKEDEIGFFDPIGKKQIPTYINLCDASYVGAIKNKMFKFGIGMNKLFDAMMGAKPILYAVDAPNNYIDDYQCGISVEAENVETLAEGIDALLSLSRQQRIEMGKRGKEAVLNNFNFQVLAKKFLEVMK